MRQNLEVKAAFIRAQNAGHCDTSECRACGKKRSWNTSACDNHLLKCIAYKKHIKEEMLYNSNQESLLKYYQSSENTSLEQLFAKAVYNSTANFTLFNTLEWSDFFKRVNFKSPTRQRPAGPLLEDIYKEIKTQVQEVVDNTSCLQIVTDGSANMAKVRIENTSFLIEGVSFYNASTAIGFQTASAQFTYNNVVKHARELTHRNLAKWASYSSDTCATQKSAWEIMNSTAETRHVLTVPCDSHSLQLILKDLIWPGKDNHGNSTSAMGELFKSGLNAVVSFFSSSDKQLALLRSVM
ncbi:hypothetical protein GcC1_070018 [Golovinomyces cichoracearum]|uniref:DUF659 domain-containing protein n=1 Tax=Golovinomyces cichoracearum TaxID=62708 RepID=A0A420IQ40_9PEZI|nr:hypothetical protein GcC1_070018 [Golovinomyces cichoracearum]